MKLTRWFPAEVKPVRPGYYKVKGCSGRPWCDGYHYWNGAKWYFLDIGFDYAMVADALPWKGILK